MYAHFYSTFAEENVTNAVWAMDYNSNIKRLDIVQALWPDNHVVEWLFFNYFQGAEFDQAMGNCKDVVAAYYNELMKLANDQNGWADIPWGLGAWGSKRLTWDGSSEVSLASRELCIDS